MKVAIGSDHGGLALKNEMVQFLKEASIDFEDVGTYTEDSVDYPVYGEKVSKAVIEGDCDCGIAICGTGLGISMACNKVKGIRAALCTNEYMAEMSRHHNNANVLCMGGRVIGPELAKAILKTFLKTPFDGGRHQRRLDLITRLEEE